MKSLKSYIEKYLDTIKETVFDLSYSIPVDYNLDYFWIVIDANSIEDNVACIVHSDWVNSVANMRMTVTYSY